MTNSRRALIGSIAIFSALLAWLFQDVVLRGRLLSYRDALQVYYSLFEYIQQEWEAGRPPLWNPYLNGGEPLLALPTSSALYPLKLIFFLPGSHWLRFHVYILLHYAIAAGTCGWVSRKWGASRPAAALAGLAYAFSGNVLFNYSTILFLCGAAWLPLALWAGDRMLRERSLTRAPLFAAVLVLMLLGGDPEMAYLAGMGTALQGGLLWWSERRAGRGERSAAEPLEGEGERLVTREGDGSRGARHRLVLLGASATIAVLLGAVQIFPVAKLGRESMRNARFVPASLYDLPEFWLRPLEGYNRPDTGAPPRWYQGFVGNAPPPAKHELDIYQFSLMPWRVVEFVWPNISRRLYQVSQVWTPSQYLGLLPFLAALAAICAAWRDSRVRWLACLACISLLASFGKYGPGRYLLDPTQAETMMYRPGGMTGAVGGMYWLLVILLPGFAQFRYPSKLLVLTTCGLCLLAAFGFDRIFAGGRRRWSRVFAVVAAVSALGAIAGLIGRERVMAWVDANRGAYTVSLSAAWRDVELALCQAAVVAGLGWVCCRRGKDPGSDNEALEPPRTWWRGGLRGPQAAWLLVLVTAVDLAIANRWMVITTDRAAWERTPELATQLREFGSSDRSVSGGRPVRIFRSDAWRYPGRELLDEMRDDYFVQWQRATLVGQQGLPFHIGAMNNTFSQLEPNEHKTWFDFLPTPDPARPGKVQYIYPRRAYDLWGVEALMIPELDAQGARQQTLGLQLKWSSNAAADGNLPAGEPLDPLVPGQPAPIPGIAEVHVVQNDSAFPPAWIVHRMHPIEPIPYWERVRWIRKMAEIVFQSAGRFDFRTEALVESDDVLKTWGKLPLTWPAATEKESCRIVSYKPQEVEIEALLSAQGMVVLSDRYTEDWTVTVSTDGGTFEPREVLKTNRTMRGVLLPAGNHRLRFEYRPWSLYLGGITSLATLFAILAWGGWNWLRSRPPRGLPAA